MVAHRFTDWLQFQSFADLFPEERTNDTAIIDAWTSLQFAECGDVVQLAGRRLRRWNGGLYRDPGDGVTKLFLQISVTMVLR